MADNRLDASFPMHINIVVTSVAQLSSVYALLGGAAPAALTAGNGPEREHVSRGTDKSSATNATGAQEGQASVGTGATAMTDASPSNGETDAHGHPWSAELHASTKGKTKDGLWRMKVGVSRPDPKPGFPVENAAGTGTEPGTPAPSATSPGVTDTASGQPATSGDEDDEFAAFRNAAAASDDADKAAAASAVATTRTYSDADLGALCNQAAVKLGDPSPIKEIIAGYVPEGQVAHSRNIPEDKRAEFVKAVEEKAGIEFAG